MSAAPSVAAGNAPVPHTASVWPNEPSRGARATSTGSQQGRNPEENPSHARAPSVFAWYRSR